MIFAATEQDLAEFQQDMVKRCLRISAALAEKNSDHVSPCIFDMIGAETPKGLTEVKAHQRGKSEIALLEGLEREEETL